MISEMYEMFPNDTSISITPEIIQRFQYQRKQYQEENQSFQSQFNQNAPNDSQYCYLISTKFIKQWKDMINPFLSGKETMIQKVQTPSLMNFQLIKRYIYDCGEVELVSNIDNGKDFQFVNRKIMRIFDRYRGIRIARRIYFSEQGRQVELYPMKFKFIFISNTWISLLKSTQQKQLLIRIGFAYLNQSVQNLQNRLIEYASKDPRNRKQQYIKNEIKLYIVSSFNVLQYSKMIIRSNMNVCNQSPGKFILSNKIIKQLDVPHQQQYFIIVELKQDKWVFEKQGNQYYQNGFMDIYNYKHPAYSTAYNYDQNYASTNNQMEQQDNQKQVNHQNLSKNRLVGLTNIGNTCYMNASLQCMIHTTQLTEYFEKKCYLKQINENNPIGSKGKIVREYAKFIKSVLSTKQNCIVQTSSLKLVIGEHKQNFSGNLQQDSQQFLLYLLDLIHQDLNRIKLKQNTQTIQSNDRQDYIVAKQSWQNYLKRNQSIIVDLFGGQYRSEIKCQNCKKISVTFDPFLTFTVSIPSSQIKTINAYILYSNCNQQPLKVTLISKNNKVKQLKQDAVIKGHVSQLQIIFIMSGFNGKLRIINDQQSVDRLTNQKGIYQFSQEKQLFVCQFQRQQLQQIKNKKFLIFKFVTNGAANPMQFRSLTFKRPFPFKIKNLTGKQLYTRIYQYTLFLKLSQQQINQCRNNKQKKDQSFLAFRKENLFKISFVCGKQTENSKGLIFYDKVIQIEDNDKEISSMLQKYNFKGQFQVYYFEFPKYCFNHYRQSSKSSHYSQENFGSQESYTLEKCLQEMKKPQNLLPGNEVYCSFCKKFQGCEKKMQLYKASQYLIIHLRRFKDSQIHHKTKNYANIQFPMSFDFSDYILSPGIPQTYFNNNKDYLSKPAYWKQINKSKSTKYKLYGVVNHMGSLQGGHYTAFAQYQGNWYEFNDCTVSKISHQTIVSSSAYLLFYKRQP